MMTNNKQHSHYFKAYLCHVTYDNCHDDPINGNSFTKDYTAEQRPYYKVSKSPETKQTTNIRWNEPDEVLGLYSWGLDPSSDDAGASDINSPAKLRTYTMLNSKSRPLPA